MFNLATTKIYIIAAVIIAAVIIAAIVGTYIFILKMDIQELKSDKVKLQEKLIECKSNNQTLKGSIATQNLKIETQKVNLSKRLNELDKWKNQPREIKYKEVIKNVEVKSNECKDIKNIINDIRTTSF
jgi:uncharacterized protein HemX